MHRNLGVQDFVLDAAYDRSPIHMVNVVAALSKKYPFRLRRMRKDILWLERQARHMGVVNPPTPEWLRTDR